MEHTVQQIKGCSAFLESLKFCDDAFRQKSMASLATSIASQIRNIKDMDVNMAAAMNVAIEGSAFSDELKAVVTQATGERCMQSSAVHHNSVCRKATQTLLKVENYFTASDAAAFSDTSLAVSQKVARLSHRLAMLGVANPSESTIRHLVAMLACMHSPDATASNLHTIVLDLKCVIHQQASSTRGGPTHYPDDPKDLSASIHASAYSADDPPVHQQLVMLPALVGRVPLRTTNKAIALSSSSPSSSSSASMQNPLNMFQAMMNTMMMQQGLRLPTTISYNPDFVGNSPIKAASPVRAQQHIQASAAYALPGCGFVPPAGVTPLLAIGDAAAPESQAGLDSASPAKPAVSTSAVDTVTMLERIAAGKVDEAPAVMKRPAAAGCAFKRPSAAATHTDADTCKPKKIKLGCSKCRYGDTGCSQCRKPTFKGCRKT
jgi:hypothetical protein